MPIYEYVCGDCGHDFEAFLRKETDTAKCPECASENLEKQISRPRVHGDTRRDRSMRAAKKRDSVQAAERQYTQRQYELNHDDH